MQQKRLFTEQAIEIGAACDRDIEMKVRIFKFSLVPTSPPACIY
jgi:hypothetical protein